MTNVGRMDLLLQSLVVAIYLAGVGGTEDKRGSRLRAGWVMQQKNGVETDGNEREKWEGAEDKWNETREEISWREKVKVGGRIRGEDAGRWVPWIRHPSTKAISNQFHV